MRDLLKDRPLEQSPPSLWKCQHNSSTNEWAVFTISVSFCPTCSNNTVETAATVGLVRRPHDVGRTLPVLGRGQAAVIRNILDSVYHVLAMLLKRYSRLTGRMLDVQPNTDFLSLFCWTRGRFSASPALADAESTRNPPSFRRSDGQREANCEGFGLRDCGSAGFGRSTKVD